MQGYICDSCGHDYLVTKEHHQYNCPKCGSTSVRPDIKGQRRIWPGLVVMGVAGAVVYYSINPQEIPRSLDDVGATAKRVQERVVKAVGGKPAKPKPAPQTVQTYDFSVDWQADPTLAGRDLPTLTRDANRAMAAEEYAQAEILLKEMILRSPRDLNTWSTLALVLTKTQKRDEFNGVMLKLRGFNRGLFKTTLDNKIIPPDWRGFFREQTGSGS